MAFMGVEEVTQKLREAQEETQQPVAFMGVEEVTVNEQDPHAVGFYR